MIIKQGESKRYTFCSYQRGTSEIIMLEPADIVFTVAIPLGRSKNVISKRLNDGITFDTTTGKYTLTLNPADTINLPPGNYAFDVKISRSGSEYFLVKEGYLTINKSYTGIIGGQNE